MEVSNDTLKRFFRNECDSEESDQVILHLEKHPELVEEYLSKTEWDEAGQFENMVPEVKEKMQGIVYASTRPVRKIVWLKRVAVAASLLGALFIGYQFLNKDRKKEAYVYTGTENARPVAKKRLVVNTGEKEIQVTLDDRTVVTLAAHSEISYDEFFSAAKRDVYLKGQAYFKVAHDAGRPFTVSSGAIATTALGTEFLVRDFEKDGFISVKLYKGKVVIRPAGLGDKKMFDAQYLLPGDELHYNRKEMTVAVKVVPKINRSERSGAIMAKRTVKETKGTTMAGWYMFNKESLPSLFDQLSDLYGVPITYSKTDMRKLYFIGRFDKTDSLENILHIICKLNSLRVEKEPGGGYLIKK